MKTKLLFISILSVILSIISIADGKIKSISDPEVDVTIKASMVGSFHATTNKLLVSETDDNYLISVDLDTLKSGIELRDSHMKKDLDVEHFPKATLEVAKKNVVNKTATITGKLSIRGETHPIDFTYTKSGIKQDMIESTMILNITHWGVPTRKYLGVGVKEVVIININFTVINE